MNYPSRFVVCEPVSTDALAEALAQINMVFENSDYVRFVRLIVQEAERGSRTIRNAAQP